jgi:hypothetical protein
MHHGLEGDTLDLERDPGRQYLVLQQDEQEEKQYQQEEYQQDEYQQRELQQNHQWFEKTTTTTWRCVGDVFVILCDEIYCFM